MAEAVMELSKEKFESEVEAGGLLLVDCWAEWCPPCKAFAPVFERVAQKFPRHKFGKLNTEKEQECAKALDIQHIPTLLLYRDGILLFKQPGYYDEDKLSDIVRQAESLDMEKVRAQIRAQEQSEKESGGNTESN
jgi:thioredoxin 1